MDSKRPTINRRHFLQTALGVSLSASLLSSQQVLATTPVKKTHRQNIKVAGYDYDRVLAIKDGRVGIEGAEISFDTKDIYAVSRHAFGPDQKYEVTELGLIPYLRKYINEGYRDYTLIPIFISRTFRHRNIFVHVPPQNPPHGILSPDIEAHKGKFSITP